MVNTRSSGVELYWPYIRQHFLSDLVSGLPFWKADKIYVLDQRFYENQMV